MMTKIKWVIVIGLLATVAMSSYFILNSPNKSKKQCKRAGGIYRIAIPSYPTTLDPIKSDWPVSMQIMNAINAALVRVEANGELAPHVAKSWLISEDRKRYTFYIRDNITFHNARHMTVDDVLGSLQRTLSSESLYRDNLRMLVGYDDYISGKANYIDGIKKISENSFELNLKYPFEPLLAMLSSVSFSILPIQEVNNDPHFFKSPIGAGPFQWGKLSGPNEIVLNTYDHFFGGKSNLESVVFLVRSEEDQMDQVYLSGDTNAQKSFDAAGYLQVPINEMRTYVISFNTSKPPFMDKRTREAVRCALNLNNVYSKLERYPNIHATSSYIPKGMLGFDPDLQKIECSVERAKQLLKDSGIKDPKDLGIITLATRLPKPAGDDVVSEIKRGLQQLGMQIEVDKTWSSLEKDLARGTAPNIFFIGYAPNYPDTFFLFNYFHSASIGFTNGARYSNKQFDELVDTSVMIEDYQERGRLLRRLNRILVEDTIVIPVYAGSARNGLFKKKVKGLEFPYINLPFPRLEKIWIDL